MITYNKNKEVFRKIKGKFLKAVFGSCPNLAI
jgi:hypothetical protein